MVDAIVIKASPRLNSNINATNQRAIIGIINSFIQVLRFFSEALPQTNSPDFQLAYGREFP